MVKISEKVDSEELNIEYWNEFYSKVKIQGESTFCTYTKQKINKNTIVVDIGCGSGRDTFSFAREGYEVIGIDRSEEAIKLNKHLCEELIFSNLKINFDSIDIADEYRLSNYFENLCQTATKNKKVIVIYLRFLLHSINESTEKILFSTLSRYLRNGDYLAAEFRTIEDQQRDKVYNDHYRRFIVAEDLLYRLENEYNFREIDFYKGTGLSVFNNEDPYLARMIMEKC